MAAAVYYAKNKGLSAGEMMLLNFEVSGSNDTMLATASRDKDEYIGNINMPCPLDIRAEEFDLPTGKKELTTVYIPGIKHIILPLEYLQGDFKVWLEENVDLFGSKKDVFGVIIFDEKNEAIYPFVSIKGALCWERGCGSGTEAVGVYSADKYKKSVTMDVKQPGGTIKVAVKYEDSIKAVSIEGKVKLVAEGTAYI